jgi:hypothetical protein
MIGTIIKAIVSFFRRKPTPVDPPAESAKDRRARAAARPLEILASHVAGQDISAVLAIPDARPAPAKNRGDRPRTYEPDRGLTSAERMRRQRWVEGKIRRQRSDETRFRHCDETSHLKEEGKKEERAWGSPILKDWRPGADGERLGKEPKPKKGGRPRPPLVSSRSGVLARPP